MPLALFDLDDTLIDRRAAFWAWAEEFVIAHGLDKAALTFLLMIDAHHSGPMGGFFEIVRREYNLAEPTEQLWTQYRRRMPELATCHPTDLVALERLRQAGWRVGAVTNGMADNQLGKIRNAGLDRLLDGWCISGDVGIRKPDQEIFRLAAERCGSRLRSDGWMIGDSLALDVAGGHAAGLRTAWLQPKRGSGAWTFTRPRPDLVINSVAEAVEALLD